MPPDLIDLALTEDIGPGDVTAAYFTAEDCRARARIIAREACVVAGTSVAVEVFRRVDSRIGTDDVCADGRMLEPGGVVLTAEGPARSLLTAERTALNFLQRLSGVATLTRRYVDAIRGTRATILDTRKTTPGWRRLEKVAVAAGGATNHRAGLYDMVLVKDNHLAAGGGRFDLQAAIRRVREEHPGLRIEIEADTLDQVRAFVALEGIDIILLDNMSLADLREAVACRRDGLAFEASGGVNLETVRAIAETGVDFISVGAVTHSARAVDLAMEFSV